MKFSIKSIVGAICGVVGLAVAVYGFFYVYSLCNQNLFALPALCAGFFTVFSLPLSVVGLILSCITRKKEKDSRLALIGVITSAIALVVIVISVVMGVNTLTFNNFTAFQNAYIFKDGEYSTIVSNLFESLHGDNWVF